MNGVESPEGDIRSVMVRTFSCQSFAPDKQGVSSPVYPQIKCHGGCERLRLVRMGVSSPSTRYKNPTEKTAKICDTLVSEGVSSPVHQQWNHREHCKRLRQARISQNGHSDPIARPISPRRTLARRSHLTKGAQSLSRIRMCVWPHV